MEEEFFWSRHEENKEFEHEMLNVINSGDIVLDVGCGSYKVHPNVLGVDAYADNPNVNVQAYMWDTPFADESVDGLLCMMALEHISKYQVMPTLIEFNRILKKGAKFIILVPNLFWLFAAFLKNPTPDWELDMIFGTQTHEGEYHKTGFTKDILVAYFTESIPNCHIKKIYDVIAYNQMCIGVVAERE